MGLCPFCGKAIGISPTMVDIYLNNNSMMPQPVCSDDLSLAKTVDAQRELLGLIKDVWVREINESDKILPEDKPKEIIRIKKLEVADE